MRQQTTLHTLKHVQSKFDLHQALFSSLCDICGGYVEYGSGNHKVASSIPGSRLQPWGVHWPEHSMQVLV